MARLRATASAARSVLDGREHDGMLDRVGAAISLCNKQTIKRRPRKTVKKRTHAHVHAGWGMRIAFVPEEFVAENPTVKTRERNTSDDP